MFSFNVFSISTWLYSFAATGMLTVALRQLISQFGLNSVETNHLTYNWFFMQYWACVVGYSFGLHNLIPEPGPEIFVFLLFIYSVWTIIKNAIQITRVISWNKPIWWLEFI